MRSFSPFVRGLSVFFIALVALVIIAPSSQAAFITPSAGPLVPGGPPVTPPNALVTNPGVLLGTMLQNFNFTTTAGTNGCPGAGTDCGTLRSAVYVDPATGGLDFFYQVFNDQRSVTALSHESNTSFSSQYPAPGVTVAYSSLAVGAFTASTIAPNASTLDLSATTVDFAFTTAGGFAKITPGTSSAILIVSTMATNFTLGNAEVIDGGSQTVQAFQPAPGVPEPASFALIGGGLLALAGIRRMRRSA